MTAIEAIYQVLADSREPLHYLEITRRIQEQGLWRSRSKTPEATVNARLSVDIDRQGSASRFRRVAPGIYALNTSSGETEVDSEPTLPPAVVVEREPLSFSDAAERVLLQSSNQQPMHYREITERALRQGLIVTQGKTPEATMYAQMHTEIERSTRRGDLPRFVKLGDGFFTLTRWQRGGLAFQIERHNRNIRSKLLEQLHELDPAEFEALVSRVLTEMGFESVEVTRISGDGGIDVRGTLVIGDVIRTTMAVQVKRWRNNVHSPIVQQVRGSLGAHERGLIITTSDFSSGAREEANRSNAIPIGLMTGEQFVRLMIQHSIGVHRSSYDIIEIGEERDDDQPSVVH